MAPSPSVLDSIKLLTLLLIVAVLSVNQVSAGPTDDRDGDGIVDTVDLDDDNDGIPDRLEISADGAERDSDLDGMPDRIDLDSDNDGILDIQESGLFISLSFSNVRIVNGRLLAPVGENGIADFLETFPDSNTPAYNLSNTDEADGDTVPDYLDLDSDNDGILDLVEAGVSSELDSDNNGRIDGGPGSVGNDGILDLAQLNNDQNCCDYDLDGIGDEIPRNTDGGDLPDFQDLDSDNDGFNDLLEAGGQDIDQDGRIDSFFDDANSPDGVDDQLFLIPLPVPDSNANGLPDYRDPSIQYVPAPPTVADSEPALTPPPNGDTGPVTEPASETEPAGDPGSDSGQADADAPADAGDAGQASTGLLLDDPVTEDAGVIETGLAGGTGCSVVQGSTQTSLAIDPLFLLMLAASSLWLLRRKRLNLRPINLHSRTSGSAGQVECAQ